MTDRAKSTNGGEPRPSQTGEVMSIVPVEQVQAKILTIRGQRVILDTDLADLYGVPTKRLNEQVKRNIKRFPPDFMFELVEQEKAEVVANCDHLQRLKFSSNLPYAFTEHGAIMAASVLNSDHAVQISVFVVRAFVQLRRMLVPYKELMTRLEHLEKAVRNHVDQIVKSAHPDRVILFGSAATGEMTVDSDLDLLVVERQVANTRQESVRLRAALEDVPFPIDVIVMSRQWFDDTKDVVGGIAYPAHKYGRVLYEAT